MLITTSSFTLHAVLDRTTSLEFVLEFNDENEGVSGVNLPHCPVPGQQRCDVRKVRMSH